MHEPIGCLGQPYDLPEFTEEDVAPLSDSAFNKIIELIAKYKTRIDSQCEINEAHDDLHKK